MAANCWWGWPMIRETPQALLRLSTVAEIKQYNLCFGQVLNLFKE